MACSCGLSWWIFSMSGLLWASSFFSKSCTWQKFSQAESAT
jgi:hypothetical protein